MIKTKADQTFIIPKRSVKGGSHGYVIDILTDGSKSEHLAELDDGIFECKEPELEVTENRDNKKRFSLFGLSLKVFGFHFKVFACVSVFR